MTRLFPYLFLLSVCLPAAAQSLPFVDDVSGRGFTERPYLRYEAERGLCNFSGADFLTVPDEDFSQENIASEASNLQAALLNNEGSYVAWTLDADADALCIRFSIPDNPEGTGTRQDVDIYSGDRFLHTVTLDSYWAWQYTVKGSSSTKYPDNTASDKKFARMRFDEVNVLLPERLSAGTELRIVKAAGEIPVTLDFVEAELAGDPLPAPENAVTFTAESSIQDFINNNPGKTIYIPAGRYEISNTLTINSAGTKLVGAGMWHTELYFTASPDNKRTYGRRGVKCSSNNCGLSRMSLNTVNNRRYYDNNPSCQTGKGLMGSWGSDSEISDVRIDHFECGAWIADYDGNASKRLKVTGCRFRNNYADGINLCSGTCDAVVSQCSFRNNGDDDMASWSTGSMTKNNLFDHCTAENNWRASSLGFFGGCSNHAANIAIYDAMESGLRINADFNGTGFSTDGTIRVENVSIRRAGTERGVCGTKGDFWGNAAAALLVSAGYFYDLNNISIENIDIYDCRFEGVRVQSGSGKRVNNLELKDITVHDQKLGGKAFDFVPGVRGNGKGHNLNAEGCDEPWITTVPSTFDFTITSGVKQVVESCTPCVKAAVSGRSVFLEPDACAGTVFFTNSAGITVCEACPGTVVDGLSPGVYILSSCNRTACKIVIF